MTVIATPDASALRQRVSISLSREELYVVMRLIKAKQIPGSDFRWLNRGPDGILPVDIQHALEAATNALMARGYLTSVKAPVDTEPLVLSMPSPVIALVGTCAFGEYSILLALNTPEGYRQMYLHELRGVAVVHTMPVPNIHQFEAVEGREAILAVLDDMLGLHAQPESNLPDGKVFTVNSQAARDAARTGLVDEAVASLARGGLPVETAQALGKAMQASVAQGAITIASRDAHGQHREAAIAIVITPQICFMLTDAGSRPATFHVQPVSAEGLRQWIVANLPPSYKLSSSTGQFKHM